MELITLIKTSETLNFTIRIFSVGILGVLYVFFSSIYSELKIFRNKDYIFLGFSLPALGFVITQVIGSNIALSLGMVGALSIIRFRTPVRSPYELVIYFALLTMGIATSVNYRYTLILFFSLILFKFLYLLLNRKVLKPFFSNKVTSNKINVNITMHLSKLDFSNFINQNDFTQLSCDNIDNEKVELNFYKSFNNKISLENFLNDNKHIIKNFNIDEN